MKVWKKLIQKLGSRGQSLVETALFLPILIFMLAGIVEVSNLLITQNRVTTASRMAAGYGAKNYDRDNWSGVDGTAFDMGVVALNTVTETMDLNSDLWDIWSIRAMTNVSGKIDPGDFVATHVYGNDAVVSNAEWATMADDIRLDIEESLQSACLDDGPGSYPCAANLEVVASVPFHNIETILGLNIWQWTGFRRLQGLTVMRVRPIVEAKGCPILPIAVNLEQYSIYPSNWVRQDPGATVLNYLWHPDDKVRTFPVGTGPTGFDYPKNPEPIYRNESIQPALDGSKSDFPRNSPGISLGDAILGGSQFRGTVFWARETSNEDTGNFEWLSWRNLNAAGTLERSLAYPGNFNDTVGIDKYPPAGYPGSTYDLDPRTGNKDGELDYHEWIANATGNMKASGVREALEDHISIGRRVSLMVFDDVVDNGSKREYQVYSFITVIIRGYSFDSNAENKWIIFEFVSPNIDCGLKGQS